MTEHRIINTDSKNIQEISKGSVQLIVTSPPYPMIEMWDKMFETQDPSIKDCLSSNDGITTISTISRANA